MKSLFQFDKSQWKLTKFIKTEEEVAEVENVIFDKMQEIKDIFCFYAS
jgi:hypothetical protein